MEKKSKFKIYSMGESLVFAIFFLILGIILIAKPDSIVKTILYIIGSIAAVVGIFKLMLYYKVSEYVQDKKDLINGIIYLIFGTVVIVSTSVFYDKVEYILRLVLSIYLLYVGVFRIVSAFKIKKEHRLPFYVNAIVVTLIALILLFVPKLPFVVVGVFLVIYSITELFGFVIEKDKYKKNEIKEAEVLRVVEPKKIESKEK